MSLSLSTTAVNTAMSCLKRYDYRYNDHLVTKPDRTSVAIRRGIWIHSCLEAIHRGHGYGRLLTNLAQWALEHGVPQDQVEEVQADVMGIIVGYQQYWEANERHKIWPVASEEKLVLELPNGDELTCTVDTVVEVAGRGLFLMEHKSTMHFPSADWRAIDPQTALQYVICKATRTYDLQGVIFNYLKTTRPPVPRVLKNGTGFYATEITTTSPAFEKGAEELAKVWSGTQEEFVAYCDAYRAKSVADGQFYHREVVYKPDVMVMQVLREVKYFMDLIKLAETSNIWPHSINMQRCQMCPYGQYGVCPTELLKGGKAEGLRREYFEEETPETRREGRPIYDAAA